MLFLFLGLQKSNGFSLKDSFLQDIHTPVPFHKYSACHLVSFAWDTWGNHTYWGHKGIDLRYNKHFAVDDDCFGDVVGNGVF
jgi:hypothetical protein